MPTKTTRKPTVRTDADLAAQTVTEVSTGAIPTVRKRRATAGAWNSPVVRSQVPDELLVSATKAAGGDANRLWFGDDGAVWILNHQRGETCISAACPACNPKG